ncbi:MAG: hypothetical protein Q7U16_12830 [Agitococcus sp.]|nr:hypothetical protein [Agitococcus sp.]
MTQTIYIAPGNVQCRVYALPYPLRPNQKPTNIALKYQSQWKEIGLLNCQLKLVWLDPLYADFREDIEGQMGGVYFEINSTVKFL